LIEATRGQIERRHPRPALDRLFRGAIFALFPYPNRLRFVLAPLVVLGPVARWVARTWTPNPERRPTNAERRTTNDQRRTSFAVRLHSLLALAPKVTWASLFSPA